MNQTLDDLEKNQNDIETPNKRKKGLKWSLIFLGIILSLGGVWAGLTKVGVIPNWFGIKALCSCIDCHGVSFDNSFLTTNPKREKCCEGTYSLYYRDFRQKHLQSDMNRKPMIYLYPTTEAEVNVKLGTPENLSHTYPKYNFEKGWNMVAQPNGDLKDIDTGRKLYALYREGKNEISTNFDEGFVVAGKDIIPFLEEKLAILGLNEREAEEFIVYRLPQMENNKYNLIRFETKAEQDENMPLNITPKPDTLIRIMMDWKAIDEPVDIPEQQLVTPERTGFTVVERGGSPRN